MHLFTDETKLNSYLDKVLKPMAHALRTHPALAAFDIINEPAGSFAQGINDANPCFNTEILKGSGTDWTHTGLHIKDVQRFINHHIQVIKMYAPETLVTVGDGEQTMTNITAHSRNYYSDHCLRLAGGKPEGVLGNKLIFKLYHDEY